MAKKITTPPTDEEVFFTARISKTLRRRFKSAVYGEGKTMEEAITEAIKEWLDRHGGK
jgi:hypothetical protein